MIGWTSQPEIGQIERQVYLQTIGESGSLLFGKRSQPKATNMKAPEYRLELETPRFSQQPRLTNRDYVLGVSNQKISNLDQRFTASYTYVRIWLVGSIVAALQILPFDSACARIAARLNAGLLNAGLLNQGTPVSITDVFIAATGLRHQWSVVTDNAKDFRRFDGLTLVDWR